MLVLTCKLSEKIVIEPDIVIAILGVNWNCIRIGISSPNPIKVRDFNPKDFVFNCNEKGRL